MKKILSFILIMSLCVTIAPSVVAAEATNERNTEKLIYSLANDGLAFGDSLYAKPQESEVKVCGIPEAVSAPSIIADGKCGDKLTWTLNGEGLLHIKGTGEMSEGAAWELYMSQINSVVIDDGATTISKNAFTWCENLSSITLPDSVISIGEGAFNGCGNLTSVKLSAGLKLIDSCAFQDCYKLSDITLPDGLETIRDGAFAGCESLTSINIPGSVTTIKDNLMYVWGVFSGCTSLKVTVSEDNPYFCAEDNVIFSKDKTTLVEFVNHELTEYTVPSSVIEIAQCAFTVCENLQTINLPNSVKNIGYSAFFECSNLDNIVIPEGVTEIAFGAFQQCSRLESIALPNSLIAIRGHSFSHCVSLTEILLPDSLEVIEGMAFNNCRKLTSVTIPKKVKELSGAFSLCDALSVSVCEENPYFVVEDNVIFSKDKTKLIQFMKHNVTEYNVPSGVTEVTDGAFKGFASLQHVTIPVGVISIGREAFSETGLLDITLPEGVQSLGHMAFGSTSLTNVKLPASLKTIGNQAFGWCNNLQSISMPGVTYIGRWAFNYSALLTDIQLSEDLQTIDDMAFLGCESLSKITIPAGVSQMGASLFASCSPLLVISGYLNTEASKYAFNHSIRFNQLGKWINATTAVVTNDEGANEIIVNLDTTDVDANILSENALVMQMNINGAMQGLNPADIGDGQFKVPFNEGTTYIKIFNWDDPESMQPLSPVLILEVNGTN